MKLSMQQINRIEKALKKANKLERQSQLAAQNIASIILEFTGVDGFVDYLQSDGFGFTTSSNNYTHIGIRKLIEDAKNGIDITEEYILDNLDL